MKTNEIVKLILSDHRELSKSTRYYNLSIDEQVNVIISQRPELKNCCLADVVKSCKHDFVPYNETTSICRSCLTMRIDD